VGCGFLALALGAWARGAPSSHHAVLWFAAWLVATILVTSRAHRADAPPGPGWAWLHIGWAMVLLPQIFNGIRFLVPALPGGSPLPLGPAHLDARRYDDTLAQLDMQWFDWDIPRWSEAVLTPALADFMMFFYAAYFVMPVILFLALAARRDFPAMRRAAFMISVGLYATYALYLVVPACGPRHAYVNLSVPLPEGLWTGAVHDLIRDLEPQPYDAFPSAHVALGTLCAVLAWPVGGFLRWTMAVLAAGTIASTLVLRYHWIMDVLAGVALVAVALIATEALARRSRRRKATSSTSHGDRMDDLLTDAS
jgi:membrane-associated phospholipid phosphatase